jgi:hypothetical protein
MGVLAVLIRKRLTGRALREGQVGKDDDDDCGYEDAPSAGVWTKEKGADDTNHQEHADKQNYLS